MQIPRRTLVKSLAAGVPLATILADPVLARAVAAGLETVTITTEGGRKVSGALALPAKTKAPAVLLIHEWWGLNDQIKSVAAELAKHGYVALAVDLFGGKVTTNADEGKALIAAMDPKAAIDILASWIDWLKKYPKADGKIATIGWCFGGGWSLNASLAPPRSPVLLHYGTQDKFITTEMVKGFEAEAKKAHKNVTVYAYNANHAFANPTNLLHTYNKEAADLAWKRTLAFLKKYDS